MSTYPISELANRYFAAYATGDRRGIEALLTPDFTFTSPHEGQLDRAAYVERCWALAGTCEYHDLKSQVVTDNECFVLYETKSKSGDVQRNVELLRFKGDRLASVEVFLGRPPQVLFAVRWGQPGLPMFTPSGV